MPRGNGSVIGPANVPNGLTASGVWTLEEALSANQKSVWPVSPDPYAKDVTELKTAIAGSGGFNWYFQDSSPYEWTIYRSGEVVQGSLNPYWPNNWSVLFTDPNDKINLPASSGLIGTSDYTFECWVNFESNNDGDGSIAGQQSLMSYGTSGNVPRLYSSTAALVFATGATVRANVANAVRTFIWYHIAVVRSGSGANNCALFLNGSRIAQFTDTTDYNTGTAEFGGEGAANYLLGWMSNIRLVNSAVYSPSSTTITVPTSPLTAVAGTLYLLANTSGWRDLSSNNYVITTTNNPRVFPRGPFNLTTYYNSPQNYVGSAVFDGSGDYLYPPNTDLAFALGSGDFTVECWFYPYDESTNRTLISNGGFSTNRWKLEYRNSGAGYSTVLTFWVGNVSTTVPVLVGTSLIEYNGWTHVAVSRSGSTIRLFVNGTLQNSATISVAVDAGTLEQIFVGGAGASNYFYGAICQPRVVKGTAVYTASFSLPTQPLTAITNTVFLLNNTRAALYDGSANTIYRVSNLQQNSLSPVKANGVSSIWTAGNNSFVRGDWEQYVTRGPFTFECWYWMSNSNVTHMLSAPSGAGYGSRNRGFAISPLNNLGFCFFFKRDGYTTFGGYGTQITPTANAWHHYAATRDINNVWRFFIDGVQYAYTTVFATWLSNTYGPFSNSYVIMQGTLSGWIEASGPIGINTDDQGYFARGYMQDMRLTAACRYTSNFTPITPPLTPRYL